MIGGVFLFWEPEEDFCHVCRSDRAVVPTYKKYLHGSRVFEVPV